jgi:hypothetical protein
MSIFHGDVGFADIGLVSVGTAMTAIRILLTRFP